MKINPIAYSLNSNKQSSPIKPVYRGLAADKFERATSFEGRNYTRPHKSYSMEDTRWKNMPVDNNSPINRVANFYSRKFMEGILPSLKEKLSEIDPNTDEPIIETIISRGDELKPLIANLKYLNSKYNLGKLDEFSAKEIAYLFSAYDGEKKTFSMAQLAQYLREKKQEVSDDEYERILTGVISGQRVHSNDLHQAPKVLSDTFASKLKEISSFGKSYEELLAQNPEQDIIQKNIEYLKGYTKKTGIIPRMTARELAFFIATDIDKLDVKNKMPAFEDQLIRFGKYLSERTYDRTLDEAIMGKRSATKMVTLMQQSPARNHNYNTYNNEDWCSHILKNT